MQVEISEGIKSVLLVEDEGIVALMMEDLLRELGVTDVQVCADVASARAVAATANVDCAVLDHHIRGGDCSEVADILAARGIPFLFSTGSGIDSLPARHRSRPAITKPFADDDFKLLLLDTWLTADVPPSAPSERVASLTLTD